ncbi:phage tail sheath family protein [Pedobacter aquatilis]|uniref:phage tail sheath family protein n=1 Tax=Pedobacter aquatilis TaxID=351343 RepID=UPI002930C99B|nr:phage tail sheath C-terminal domain-containing protein [Pedobacter aquatilis]
MSKQYQTPGVYIQETSRLAPVISPVDTAIPAFIGKTEFKNIDEHNRPVPVKISSLADYEHYFGIGNSEHSIFLVSILNEPIDVLNHQIEVNIKKEVISGRYMYYAMLIFYANGGGPCYVVSAGDYSSAFDDNDGIACLNAIEDVDEVTILVFTDKHFNQTETSSGYKMLNDLALLQCNKLRDRIAIFNSWINSSDVSADLEKMRSDVSMENLKYGCMYYPWLHTSLNYCIDESQIIIKHLVNDIKGALDGTSLCDIENKNLYELIKSEIHKHTIELPPSPAIAGVMRSVDDNRGVWKAPANVSLNLTLAPVTKVTDSYSSNFNVDVHTGKSVNLIKYFVGKGTLVWGARTLAGNDNEWRYISVRRLFNFVEESIEKSIQPFVFEPNDANTWLKIKAMCENFLTILWRSGALMGSKSEHAFFVNIGLGKTMTAIDILEGKLILEIGLAPVKPAEFIIIRLKLNMQIN